MRLLLDTHLLLWAAAADTRRPIEAAALIADPANAPMFSAASIWEVAIKRLLGRPDFTVDARSLRRGLLDNGYECLPVTDGHAAATGDLPVQHKNPFDRILIAQATTEGITLLTSDPPVAAYPGPIRKV